MNKEFLRDAIDTYNELLRLHQLNLELLETLELSLFCLIDFSNKHNISIPNRQKFSRLLNKAHTLVTEISSPSFLQRRKPSDENLHHKESDEDFTEPF